VGPRNACLGLFPFGLAEIILGTAFAQSVIWRARLRQPDCTLADPPVHPAVRPDGGAGERGVGAGPGVKASAYQGERVEGQRDRAVSSASEIGFS
jgi:hypothetical protein